MRIYSSILLSSLLLTGGTTFYQGSGDRSSPLFISNLSETQILADSRDPDNKPCARGGSREDCSFRLNDQFHQSIDAQKPEDNPRGTGRLMG